MTQRSVALLCQPGRRVLLHFLTRCCAGPGRVDEKARARPGYLCPLTLAAPPQAALQLECCEGSVPPHSQDTVILTACPKRRAQYSWTISYSLLSHRGTWASCGEARAREGRREVEELYGAGLGAC